MKAAYKYSGWVEEGNLDTSDPLGAEMAVDLAGNMVPLLSWLRPGHSSRDSPTQPLSPLYRCDGGGVVLSLGSYLKS